MEETILVTSRDSKILGKIRDQVINRGVTRLETGQGIGKGNFKDTITKKAVEKEEIFASRQGTLEIGDNFNLTEEILVTA